MDISPARMAAFDILLRIENEKAFSSVLLASIGDRLQPNDRSLCHEITLGTLRRQISLDGIIDKYSKGRKLDAEIRIAIRIGLYQLIYLDRVPDYSAINESVNLAVRAKKRSARGFVNAILRRAAREIPTFDFADEIDRISFETSHPKWLIERWVSEFGIGEAFNIAAANNEIPKTAFRFTNFTQAKTRESDAFKDAEKSEYVEGCYLTGRIAPEMLKKAERGEIYFQDEASQMAANAVDLESGQNFLDVCAAPGSKTTQIAKRFSESGVSIIAGELHRARADLLRQNCERQGVPYVRIARFDAERTFPFADESFDVILVDAPCSGTGTIRHNPEIRYFINEVDFYALSGKQLGILQNASKMLRSGGKLIYSTCSLERRENEDVCAEFLSSNLGFKTVEPNVSKRFITADGFVRTFPHRDLMDGFFIAVFQRG